MKGKSIKHRGKGKGGGGEKIRSQEAKYVRHLPHEILFCPCRSPSLAMVVSRTLRTALHCLSLAEDKPSSQFTSNFMPSTCTINTRVILK